MTNHEKQQAIHRAEQLLRLLQHELSYYDDLTDLVDLSNLIDHINELPKPDNA